MLDPGRFVFYFSVASKKLNPASINNNKWNINISSMLPQLTIVYLLGFLKKRKRRKTDTFGLDKNYQDAVSVKKK